MKKILGLIMLSIGFSSQANAIDLDVKSNRYKMNTVVKEKIVEYNMKGKIIKEKYVTTVYVLDTEAGRLWKRSTHLPSGPLVPIKYHREGSIHGIVLPPEVEE